MSRIFAEFPGWKFEDTEISAGVYMVRGVDEDGRTVEATGTDIEMLLNDCKKKAKRIMQMTNFEES